MTDNEILLALSNIIEPVRTDIQEIKADVKKLEQKVGALEESTDHKLQSLEERMDHKLQSLEERMDHKLQTLETNMNHELQTLNHRLRKIELTQENEILPRLRTIEACYISTYDRYKESVEEHDRMKEDISLLKDVVTEHSIKLQKIS